MRTYLVSGLSGLLLLALAQSAAALPTVSIDADPALAGVQATRTVTTSEFFDVDVLVTGVDPQAPLNGFQFDLTFDPAVVNLVSAVDGGFLLDPVVTIFNDVDNTSGSLLFASLTVGVVDSSGDGLLAKLVFQSMSAGVSLLNLDSVFLTGPLGVDIPLAGINDASVQVQSPVSVPEPAVLVLLSSMLTLFAGRRKRG